MIFKVSFLRRFISPWTIWGIGALFIMFQFVLQGSTSLMIPQLIDSFSVDIFAIGVLTSSYFYSYLFLQIPSGIIADHIGPKRLLLISTVLATIACILFAFSQSFQAAMWSRIFIGFSTAPAIVCGLCLAANWFDARKFALVLGLTETAALVGGGIGQIVIAEGVHAFGWRKTMLLCALFAFILIWAVIAIVHNQPSKKEEVPKPRLNFSFKNSWSDLVRVLKNTQIWIAGFVCGLNFAVFPAFAALWGVPFFKEKYSVSLTQAGILTAMLFFGASVGCPLLGNFSQFISRRCLPISISTFISIFLLIAIIWLPNLSFSLLLVMNFLLGFFVSGYLITFALIAETLPKSVKGLAMGFTNTLCISVGAPVIQPLIGFLLKLFSKTHIPGTPSTFTTLDFELALTTLPVLLLISFILSLFIKETYCKSNYQ